MRTSSPALVRGVLNHARLIHSRNDRAYDEFVSNARFELPERAADAQFDYIIRRIWMDGDFDEQAFWQRHLAPTLRTDYERIDATMEWGSEGLVEEGWVTARLVKRTLSVWQAIIPLPMTSDHALRILRSAARIGDLGVQL